MHKQPGQSLERWSKSLYEIFLFQEWEMRDTLTVETLEREEVLERAMKFEHSKPLTQRSKILITDFRCSFKPIATKPLQGPFQNPSSQNPTAIIKQEPFIALKIDKHAFRV